MGDGGTQLAGDGLGGAIDILCNGVDAVGLGGVVVGIETDIEVRVGIFDGSESRNDGSIGVVDLSCQYIYA